MLFPSARVAGLGETSPVEATRAARGLAVFGGSLLAHLTLLGALFLWSDVALGTVEYREIALNVARGHGFVLGPGEAPILWRPPLYIYFLALVYSVFGEHHLPVVLLQAILAAATVAIAYRIAARVFGERVGAVTAVVATAHPLLWYNAGRVMTETLFAFLLSIVVLLLLDLVTAPRWWGALALGVAVGLASLCRATFQFFPLALLGVAAWPGAWERPVGERLRRTAAVAVIATAVILPWSARNAVVSGGHVIPVDTSGGYTAWVGNTRLTDGLDDDGLAPEGREALKAALARLLDVEPSSPDVANGRIFERAWSAEGNRVLFRAAIREVSADPLASAWLAVRKLGRFWFSLMGEQNRRLAPVVIALQLMVLLPAALGAVLAIREGRMVLPLFVVVGYLVALHVAATANARYSVPVLPYIIMLGVYAIHRLADRQRA